MQIVGINFGTTFARLWWHLAGELIEVAEVLLARKTWTKLGGMEVMIMLLKGMTEAP